MASPLPFFRFRIHRKCNGRMLRPVEVGSESGCSMLRVEDAAAAARHRRHKQSAYLARRATKTSAATCTSSHQQPATGAPHENSSPQAAHFFKVGAVPSDLSSGSPPLIVTWPSVESIRAQALRNMALDDFLDRFFRLRPDKLVRHLPALENQQGGNPATIEFARRVDVLIHFELHHFQLPRVLF